MRFAPHKEFKAFTLVEVLVVIGIVAALVGLLLPALNGANEQAKTVACLSNLRQLSLAAQMYCDVHQGAFPSAQYRDSRPPLFISYAWDFTTVRNTSNGQTTVTPGLLWLGHTNPKIQQCPSYDGKSNTAADPYTGYNYNTSYIGHGSGETIEAPAKICQVRRPSRCALFGDGQYSAGANKYMRSPFLAPGDRDFASRSAGTQGFRHRGKTNVVFVDGHAETLSTRYTSTIPGEQARIAPGTGFISSDNTLYDIE